MGIWPGTPGMESGGAPGGIAPGRAVGDALGAPGGGTPAETWGEVFPRGGAVVEDARRRLRGGPPRVTSPGESSLSADSSSFAPDPEPMERPPGTLGCWGTGMEVRLIGVPTGMDEGS